MITTNEDKTESIEEIGDTELMSFSAGDLPPELLKALAGGNADNRVIGLFGDIGPETSSAVLSALVSLQMEDPDEEITIFINSGGGNVTDALAIWDAIEACSCPIVTIGVGRVMSAAAFLMYAGDKGRRYLSPNTLIMAHQVSYGAMGTYSEMKVAHAAANMLKERMLDLMAKKANLKGSIVSRRKKLAKVWEDPHDQYFWPEEGIEALGLADNIGLPHSE